MRKKIKLKYPTTVDGITLKMHQEYVYALSKFEDISDEDYKMVVVSCSCGLSYGVVKSSMSIKDIDKISIEVTPLFKRVSDLESSMKRGVAKEFNPFVKVEGVEYGFITDFEGLTGGEFADLSSHIKDWGTMHKAMSVLYRPITNKKRNLLLKITQYDTESYEGSQKYGEKLKSMSALKVVQTLYFIESSYQSCQSIFLTYTQNLLSKTLKRKSDRDMDLKKLSQKIGVGINHSMP